MSSWPLEWFDEIDSTNEEARRRVASGAFSNHWIAARSQAAGRGRLGREWRSPEGNLYTTALFQFRGTMVEASKIPFVAALAVVDVFSAFVPQRPVRLKWPNDVRCDGAKVCGILTEAGPLEQGCWVAVGIGINVQGSPADLAQMTTSLAELRAENSVTTQMVLDELRQAFAIRLQEFNSGFETTREEWLKHAEGLKETIKVNRGNEPLIGIFEGLGADGELLLRLPDQSQVVITAGDVELVKERAL